MFKLTKTWLKKHHACSTQLNKFIALFPKGMPFTEENIFTLAYADLDVAWLVHELINDGLIHISVREELTELVEMKVKFLTIHRWRLSEKKRNRHARDLHRVFQFAVGIAILQGFTE